MANPITLRNVNLPNFEASNELSAAATDTMNRGMQSLISAARGAGNRADQATEDNSAAITQRFSDQIRGLNADQLAQAQESGQFAGQNLAGVTTADRGSISNLLRGRGQAIENETQQAFDNERNVERRSNHPILEMYGAEISGAKNKADLDAILAKVGTRGATDAAQRTILNQITSKRDDFIDRDERAKTRNDKDIARYEKAKLRSANQELNKIMKMDVPPSEARALVDLATAGLPANVANEFWSTYQQGTAGLGGDRTVEQDRTLQDLKSNLATVTKRANIDYDDTLAQINQELKVEEPDLLIKSQVVNGDSAGKVMENLQNKLTSDVIMGGGGTFGIDAWGKNQVMDAFEITAKNFETTYNKALPGWLLDEALTRAGTRGSDEGAFTIDKSVNWNKVDANINTLYKRYLRDQGNLVKKQQRLLTAGATRDGTISPAQMKYDQAQMGIEDRNTDAYNKTIEKFTKKQ